MGRIILAGIVGGVMMFMWGFLLHMVVTLGDDMGVKSLPENAALNEALKTAVPRPGVYLFPGMDMERKLTDEEQKAWNATYEGGPTGLLLLYPKGREIRFTRWIIVECVSDILAALLAAWIISKMATTYACRLGAAISFGLIAWLVVNVSYWNWYGFPRNFIIGEGIDIVGGWLLAGIVVAAIVRPRVVIVQV